MYSQFDNILLPELTKKVRGIMVFFFFDLKELFTPFHRGTVRNLVGYAIMGGGYM